MRPNCGPMSCRNRCICITAPVLVCGLPAAEDRIGTGTVPKFAPARFRAAPGAVARHIQRNQFGPRQPAAAGKCRKPGLTRMWRDMCRA